MKAAVYYETGGPEVFRYEEVPDPVVRPGRGAGPGRGGQHRGRRHPQPAGRRHRPGCPTSSATSAPARCVAVGDGVAGSHRGDRVVTVGSGRIPRRAAGSRRAVLLADPRRAVDRGGGLRAGPLRHRRRLPVRVRAPPAGRDRPDPRRSQRRRASPPSSWPSGPAPRCWPPRPATSGSTAWSTSASTTASTTRRPTSSRRSAGSPTAGAPTSSWTRSAAPPCRGASTAWPTGGGASPSATPVGSAGRRSTSRPCGRNNQTLVGYFLGAELFLGTAGPRHDRRPARRRRSRRAPGGHRPAVPPRAGRRGPRLHREPAGVRPGAADPVTALDSLTVTGPQATSDVDDPGRS